MLLKGLIVLLLFQLCFTNHCGDNRIRIPHPFHHELRFFLFSDIYTLTPLARISTAIKSYSQDDIPLILVIPGDFLFPIDKIQYDFGKSMVSILNELSEFGVISLGNHEDIEINELTKRLEEFKYPVVSSNFPDSVLSHCLQKSVIVEMEEEPVLGIMGLLSNNHNVVPKIAFGGAQLHDPIETAQSVYESDFRSEKLDFVALTHMEMEEDKQFIQQLTSNPDDDHLLAVFGAHDHEMHTEGPIYKCAVNGESFCVLDFVWPNDSALLHSDHGDFPTGKPTIHTQVKQSRDFEEDPHILEMIRAVPLDNSTYTKFFEIPLDIGRPELVTVRRHPNAIAEMVLQYLVDAFPDESPSHTKAEIAFFSGGNLRGEKVFTPGEYFTLRDIKDIFPWEENYPVLVPLPGQLIEDWLIASRLKPGSGAYLQHNKNLTVDRETTRILSVNDEPFDPNRIYQVVVNNIAINGTDNHTHLLEYLEAHQEVIESIPVLSSISKMFVKHFSKLFLSEMIANYSSLAEMDANRDHKLDVNELSSSFATVLKLQPTPPIISAMLQLLGSRNPLIHDAFVEDQAISSNDASFEKNTTMYGSIMSDAVATPGVVPVEDAVLAVNPSSYQALVPPPSAVLLESGGVMASSDEIFQK